MWNCFFSVLQIHPTSVFFLFCQQSPLTTIHLIYLSPYLYLNTVSLLSQHYQHYLTSISTLLTLTHFLKPCTSVTDFFLWLFHNGHHCACPSCTFDSWIQKNTNRSPLELLAWYIWRRTACATERMCQRTINICHMSFTPPCNFTVLEQEIHGYLNLCLAKLILRQLL